MLNKYVLILLMLVCVIIGQFHLLMMFIIIVVNCCNFSALSCVLLFFPLSAALVANKKI